MYNMFGDFKVQIQDKVGRETKMVFLYQHNREGTVFITHKGEAVTVKEGELPNEQEVYFAEMTDDMLIAFAESLSNRGIKTNKDSIAEGKLSATERHLEDMRTIALAKFNPLQTSKDKERS